MIRKLIFYRKSYLSCCPSNSYPFLNPTLNFKGKVIKINNLLSFYITSESNHKENVNSAIIIIPDVWGFAAGRVRIIADFISEQLQRPVYIPKILQPPFEGGFEGDGMNPNFDMPNRQNDFLDYIKTIDYESSIRPKIYELFTYLHTNNIQLVSLIGFCW